MKQKNNSQDTCKDQDNCPCFITEDGCKCTKCGGTIHCLDGEGGNDCCKTVNSQDWKEEFRKKFEDGFDRDLDSLEDFISSLLSSREKEIIENGLTIKNHKYVLLHSVNCKEDN